jgi:hypothetical protein
VACANLQSCYQDDLEESFIDECHHIRSYLLGTAEALKKRCAVMREKKWQDVYPYINIAFRMFLCTAATNYVSITENKNTFINLNVRRLT